MFRRLLPDWQEADEIYDFLSVDGGLLNNEPFEHAHRLLRPQKGMNERAGNKCERSVILVAPFPSEQEGAYKEPDGPVSFAGAVLTSLMEQVRFKPEELILALDEDVYSRFLVSPKRPERLAKGKIAGATLGGFGGFIHEEFRHHDFMLGRRNCQQFLKTRFALPAGYGKHDPKANPLFSDWRDALRRDYQFVPKGDHVMHLPIIPLVGTAVETCPRPNWPSYPPEKLNELSAQIHGRAINIGNSLIVSSFDSRLWRSTLKFALSLLSILLKRKIQIRINSYVANNLHEHSVRIVAKT